MKLIFRIYEKFSILAKLVCKIKNHDWYAFDYVVFGWELKQCPRCGIGNVYVDKQAKLHKLDSFKSINEIEKLKELHNNEM